MYKSFYNLKRNPFEITPDPSFLFATPAAQRSAGGAVPRSARGTRVSW